MGLNFFSRYLLSNLFVIIQLLNNYVKHLINVTLISGSFFLFVMTASLKLSSHFSPLLILILIRAGAQPNVTLH